MAKYSNNRLLSVYYVPVVRLPTIKLDVSPFNCSRQTFAKNAICDPNLKDYTYRSAQHVIVIPMKILACHNLIFSFVFLMLNIIGGILHTCVR